jgi:hypothetical protein
MTTDFVEFQKIPRLSRDMIITEKIDGTNGCIFISPDGEFLVGSRTRWITPENDNHGFAAWAYANKDELLKLGPGRHFGEWWGSGIQRGYGLTKGDKRFSLFNVTRWCLFGQEPGEIGVGVNGTVKKQDVLPQIVGLVPVVFRGPFSTEAALEWLGVLGRDGSLAAPGFMNPEGIVVFHVAGNYLFKKTLDGDGTPKSIREKKHDNDK